MGDRIGFLQAAKFGKLEELRDYLKGGSNVINICTSKGVNALHLASLEGHVEIVVELLKFGFPVDSKSQLGNTSLHIASLAGHLEVVKILINHKAEINARGQIFFTPLYMAAQEGHYNIVEYLLANGADQKLATDEGYMPLDVAMQQGHGRVKDLLIEHGKAGQQASNNSDIEMGDRTGFLRAAKLGKLEELRDHLKRGFNVNFCTSQGLNALHLASHEGHVEVLEELLKFGYPVDSKSKKGNTSLHISTLAGHLEVVKILIDHKAEVNARAQNFFTPLYMAAQEGHSNIVEYLLANGADQKLATDDGYTPLNVAMQQGHDRVSTLLIEHGKDGLTVSNNMNSSDIETQIKELHLNTTIFARNTDCESDLSPFELAPGGDLDLHSPNITNVDGGFPISFLVDKRGGAIHNSDVRIIIPPGTSPEPMRITCRCIQKEKLQHPPALSDGEMLASRFLEIGPNGAKFMGPIIVEIPHFASMRNRERELVIIRSDDGENWKQHHLEATKGAIRELLNEYFDSKVPYQLDDLNTTQTTRIVTTNLPQYFALVARFRQEVCAVGPDGGIITSTVIPQVKAIFPQGALTKTIKIGLQTQQIAQELVTKLHGSHIAVSPIVTVEPRKRKFHKAVTLCIPLPLKTQKSTQHQKSDAQGQSRTLRLLCSITEGTSIAEWEDITGKAQLIFDNKNVSFGTNVSARFWLVDCDTNKSKEAAQMAQKIYNCSITDVSVEPFCSQEP